MKLEGAIVLVTGGARGLGRAIAEALAQRGAHIAIADILADELDRAAPAMRDLGATVLPLITDISDEARVAEMVDEAERELGPIEVLVNNAGSLSAIGPIWEAPAAQWRRDMTVNLWGTYLCTRACLGGMVSRGGGYVISIVGAGVDPPHLYRSGYDCSKAGVVKLMEALAKEAGAHGVKAFSVFPGAVYTEMTRHMLESPEGQRWLPGFRDIFAEHRDQPLAATARRVVELVEGRADLLTGRYIRVWAPLDEILAGQEDILGRDALTLDCESSRDTMPEMRRFEGRVALITGGASGLGRAAALRLASEGASVAIADVDAARGETVREEIEALGARALFARADVTREDDCRRMVEATVVAFGRLDVLFTSAGVGSSGTVTDTDEAYWDGVVDLVLKGVFLASKYAIPAMRKSGGGSIVHVASIGGLRGDWGGAAFSAAKGGVINLTRHMAVAHAAEGIRVNCICPGVVRTPLTEEWLRRPGVMENVLQRHPIGRLGEPEDVAAAVAYLASDEATFVTGAILAVDGGSLAKGR